MTTAWHRLSAADLGGLAGGLGGAQVVGRLRDARLSKHLLLVAHIARGWPGRAADRDAAVIALGAVQARDPGVYAHLMSDPLTGAWAARVARRLQPEPVDEPVPLAAELGQLGALAAAGALRAGVEAEVTAYARHGRVTLPTVADVVTGVDGPVRLVVGAGGVRVVGESPVRPGDRRVWRPVRTLTGRHGASVCEVTVEEGNPYRDCYHAPAAHRMPADEVGFWQETFAAAWTLLCRHLPERAAEFAAGLRCLVPLVDDGSGAARSGTARDAFGMMGLTRPRSPVDLLITLVHEFQHSKLSAVLDLAPLYEPGGTERHFAPWRTDPRPTSGLIQGVYAFLGIADAWRALRAVPRLREAAEEEFADARAMVEAGMAALEGSAELTPEGRRFTAGMRSTLEDLLAERLPERAVRRGRAALAERHATWRERNAAVLADGGA